MTEESRREPCPSCGRVLQVTAEGKIRQHGYARGGDDKEKRCPGSGEAPHRQLPCFSCHGEKCDHCDGTGKVNLDQVQSYDAVIVAERAIEAWPGASAAFHGASVVEALLKHGFIHEDPEEVPHDRHEPNGSAEEAALMAELLTFFDAWKQVVKGPQKPEVVQAAQKVMEAMNAWQESRKAS